MPKKNHRPNEIIGKIPNSYTLIIQCGKNVAEVIKSLVVNNATYFLWKKEYEGKQRHLLIFSCHNADPPVVNQATEP